MATALITHEDCHQHVTPPGHPERVARLEAVMQALEGADALHVEAPLAADADLLLAHPQAYVDRIRAAAPAEGVAQLDADTHMSPGSLQAALRSAGGAVAAVDMVLAGEARNAFVACRPPGHHAETATPMGFCLFGNVAIAALHALERHGLSRVAVVDFDVHHGNGTQDLLWNEPRALFVSSHQMPLWPGSGSPDEIGAHGNVMNLPLDPGDAGAQFRAVYERTALPAIDAFAPELLLVSAGFDAHEADPLASIDLVEDDFAWITERLVEAAQRHCGGRVVSCLEGGYDLRALASSAAAHFGVLAEDG